MERQAKLKRKNVGDKTKLIQPKPEAIVDSHKPNNTDECQTLR